MFTCTGLLVTIPILLQIVSGDSCNDYYGQRGECMKLSNCPSAMELIKNKVLPKHCGFDQSEPIVCCVEITSRFKTENLPFPPGCRVVFTQPPNLPSLTFVAGIGGINSLSREFPHMAALGYDNEGEIVWICGGTLITRQHVLTAAHCVANNNYGKVKYVRLGDLNLKSDTDDADPQDFKVIERIKHPQHKHPYNDIAILKLDKPCELTPYVRPACLNTKKEFPDVEFSATGWGSLGYGEKQSDHLQNMIIRIYNHTKCAKAYSKIRRLPKGIDEETQFCAGAPYVDTCPGDSGGPLQIYTSDNTVYGVTSFGVHCGLLTIPGVYTKVSAYIPWIKSVIYP